MAYNRNRSARLQHALKLWLYSSGKKIINVQISNNICNSSWDTGVLTQDAVYLTKLNLDFEKNVPEALQSIFSLQQSANGIANRASLTKKTTFKET